VLAINAQAQSDYTKSLNGIEWVKIKSRSEITIKTHDKNEILIKALNLAPIPSKAKGLKLVGIGGEDNTDIGFNVVQTGNDLIVESVRKSGGAEIYLPKSQNVSVTNTWDGDIYIEGFTGEVEANAKLNGGLTMSNISGPITAYALNEDIKVVFNTINQNSPIVIRTTNGEIDVTLPENTKADLELNSWNGDAYTNFDLKRPDRDGLKSISGKNVKGAINGGGVNIQLKSTNGNIYLRKK
jgi:predicted membrane protein